MNYTKYSFILLLFSLNIFSGFRNLTEKNIIQDLPKIKKFIKKTGFDIERGLYHGKERAAYWKNISSKAFDAMPVDFFEDNNEVEEAIGQLTNKNAIEYINEGIKEFEKNEAHFLEKNFWGSEKLSLSKLAEFLHDKGVDHLTLKPKEKDRLKANPLLMSELLKTHKINKEEYNNIICQNITIQFYIKKELKKKGKN